MPCNPDLIERLRERRKKADADGDKKLASLLDFVEEDYQGLAQREAELENELDAALEAVRLHERQAFERKDTAAELDWRARADRMEIPLHGFVEPR